MQVFKTKKKKIVGTNFKEVNRLARLIFKQITRHTKRTPYLRSKYFKGQKIFLSLFWQHLYEKSDKDRARRLKYYDGALDVIKNSNNDPVTRENFAKKDELLHRFYGITIKGEKFVVQIKENKKTKRKDFISVYPE